MNHLNIDIETKSGADLSKAGVYKYVEDADFDILLFAFSYNGSPVHCYDLTKEELPEKIIALLTDPSCIKHAHNAMFEMACLSKKYNLRLNPYQWQCTMVKAAMLGLPFSLEQVGAVLNIDAKKDNTGKALIRFFCMPAKPSRANGFQQYNDPRRFPEKWNNFIMYCKQDVRAEMDISNRISFFNVPQFEVDLWALDYHINTTGVPVALDLVQSAIQVDAIYKEKLLAEAIEISGVDLKQVQKLKDWLFFETGEEVTALNKQTLPDLIKRMDGDAKRMLLLRREMAKTSVKKYEAMLRAVCNDGRLRGILQFYGANRTGRWAGRLTQVHNLPTNRLPYLQSARWLVIHKQVEHLSLLGEEVLPDVLSQLIRTAFVPSPGHRLIIADFAAIEARVIAWLAGEKWRLDLFYKDDPKRSDIYKASASQMFNVPYEAINKDYRQRGKVAELALGYQGGVNALTTMDIQKKLTEEEKPGIVKLWRSKNKRIVALWYAAQNAAIKAVKTGLRVRMSDGYERTEPSAISKLISFQVKNDVLYCYLPSGRFIAYQQPRLEDGQFGPSLTYKQLNQERHRWEKTYTYGGKLVENIVQAIARDCLAVSLLRLFKAGYKILFHVHDEVILDVPFGTGSIHEVETIMAAPIKWAPGLPLKAVGFENEFYKKDD